MGLRTTRFHATARCVEQQQGAAQLSGRSSSHTHRPALAIQTYGFARMAARTPCQYTGWLPLPSWVTNQKDSRFVTLTAIGSTLVLKICGTEQLLKTLKTRFGTDDRSLPAKATQKQKSPLKTRSKFARCVNLGCLLKQYLLSSDCAKAPCTEPSRELIGKRPRTVGRKGQRAEKEKARTGRAFLVNKT